MNEADEVLHGSIDMHVHFSPDPRGNRWGDCVRVALSAQEAGMAGLVLKNHSYPTQPVAYVTSQIAREIKLFGCVCLDFETGGLNPEAVEVAGRIGARVVWMPTFSAKADRTGMNRSGKSITVLDEAGGLLPEVNQILRLIKEYDMVLATGHLGPEEVFALVRTARQVGIDRIVVTHPTEEKVMPPLSVAQQTEVAALGAYIEHCAFGLMPAVRWTKPQVMATAIKTVGADHCIMSSDLGQATNPAPVEGLRMGIEAMLECGLSKTEVELIVKTNPARLVGLG